MDTANFGALQVLEGRDFSPALAQSWLDLMEIVWPTPGAPRSLESASELLRSQGARHFLRLDADGRMLAHASLFTREMSSEGATFQVGCLARVCVRPELRSLGMGREMVVAAFAALPQLAPVMLFQTGVPHFYEKLGAREVSNRFVDARSDEPEKNPFWQEHAMIFPRHYAWPESVVDIGGAGF